MEIGIICVPFQTDMARWGMARGPQAILDAGLIARLRASGHAVSEPIWIEFPNSERTRDTVTEIAHRKPQGFDPWRVGGLLADVNPPVDA